MEKREIIDIGNLRGIMEQRGMGVGDLARLAKVSSTTLRRLLDGVDQTNMSSRVGYNIANALGVTFESLLHNDYKHNPKP